MDVKRKLEINHCLIFEPFGVVVIEETSYFYLLSFSITVQYKLAFL
jgi:hypothetical protein